MAFTQLTLGLTLTIPTAGTRNWAGILKSSTWTAISGHDHTGNGRGAPLGPTSFADYAIGQTKLSKNRGDFYYSTPLVPVADAQTVDFSNGQVQVLDLGSATADVTVTLTNPIVGGVYTIYIIQAATPKDIIWPGTVKWPQGQKPLLTQTDDARDSVRLYYDGTSYFGTWELDYI